MLCNNARLWHKLSKVTNLDWIPLRSIGDMLIISLIGLEDSIRGKELWDIT